ncbi:hypothetical protein [Pedobacter sp.]
MKKHPKFYLPIEENTIKVPRFEESAGFYTTKKRSKIMAKIKGSNSKPELLLRKALWKANIRFRIHRNDLPGKPDVVIENINWLYSLMAIFGTVTNGTNESPTPIKLFGYPK